MPQMGPMNWIILYILFLSIIALSYVMSWNFMNITIWKKDFFMKKGKIYNNKW